MLCDDVVCQLGPALISGCLCQLGLARYDPMCSGTFLRLYVTACGCLYLASLQRMVE